MNISKRLSQIPNNVLISKQSVESWLGYLYVAKLGNYVYFAMKCDNLVKRRHILIYISNVLSALGNTKLLSFFQQLVISFNSIMYQIASYHTPFQLFLHFLTVSYFHSCFGQARPLWSPRQWCFWKVWFHLRSVELWRGPILWKCCPRAVLKIE